jgi:hypothetical protein
LRLWNVGEFEFVGGAEMGAENSFHDASGCSYNRAWGGGMASRTAELR